MAYALPSSSPPTSEPTAPVRAPYPQIGPGVEPVGASPRADPAAELRTPPRDAFREKAERAARLKTEKAARKKSVAATTPAAPVARPPKAEPPPAIVMPRLVATTERPLGSSRSERPVFKLHVNPIWGAATAPLTATAAPVIEVVRPGGLVRGARPSEALSKPRGGGGGGGPPDAETEKVIDRDLLMGGLIATALLLFLGWNMFAGKRAPQPTAPEPVLKVAAAPKPDAFSPSAPIELRPQAPLPAPEPSPSQTAQLQVPPVAPSVAPDVKPAQAPPAVSACQQVRMVQAYFCTASSDLTPGMRAALEKQLGEWKACLGGEALQVRGFADTRGSSDYNARLSTARAGALRDFLKSHEIRVADAKGEGELPGLADNQNCQNQRRVDVSIGDAQPSSACAPPKDASLPVCGQP